MFFQYLNSIIWSELFCFWSAHNLAFLTLVLYRSLFCWIFPPRSCGTRSCWFGEGALQMGGKHMGPRSLLKMAYMAWCLGKVAIFGGIWVAIASLKFEVWVKCLEKPSSIHISHSYHISIDDGWLFQSMFTSSCLMDRIAILESRFEPPHLEAICFIPLTESHYDFI